MWNDPIVQEVRTIREQLAAEFNFNVQAIFADLRNRERKLGRRLVHEAPALANKLKAANGDSAARNVGG